MPLAIAFLLYVSLRRGEITALRFEDCFERHLLLVQAFSHGSGQIENLKDAKGWRKVVMVPQAKEIVEFVRSERERLGLPIDGSIFCVDDRHQSFYSSLGKTISKYCDELHIPKRSLHSTRRTCASIMRKGNVSDTTIQGELGHNDLRTTQQSYLYDMSSEDDLYNSIAKAME